MFHVRRMTYVVIYAINRGKLPYFHARTVYIKLSEKKITTFELTRIFTMAYMNVKPNDRYDHVKYTGKLQEIYKKSTRNLLEIYEKSTRNLLESTRNLQEIYEKSSSNLTEIYMKSTRNLREN